LTDKTDAWMPLWIGAYLADTQHLARDEHGAYLLLLMAYWRTGGPLPDDDKRLSAIAKATAKEWKTLRPTMAEFFIVAEALWTHKRVEQELAGSLDRKQKAADKASKAAGARWKDHKKDAPGNAPSIPQALLKDVLEECPTPSPTSSLRSEDIGEFEAAWTAYPNRPGASKAGSLKAWNARIKAGASAAEMLAGVERYAAFCKASGTEPQFIKQPTTFFGPDEHFRSDWTFTPAAQRQATGQGRYAAAAASIFDSPDQREVIDV